MRFVSYLQSPVCMLRMKVFALIFCQICLHSAHSCSPTPFAPSMERSQILRASLRQQQSTALIRSQLDFSGCPSLLLAFLLSIDSSQTYEIKFIKFVNTS